MREEHAEATHDADQEQIERTLERIEAMEALAERILGECRVTLMMSFRFLDRALWKMPVKSLRLANVPSNVSVSPRSMLSCDGHTLLYNATAVIGTFRANPDLAVRSYLHTVLHCVFRHPFHTVRADKALWSLACDICIEAIVLEMCHGRYRLREDEALERLIAHASELCGGITPGKLYRLLMLGRTEETGTAEQLRLAMEFAASSDAFARDDHQLWDLVEPPPDDQPETPPGGGGDNDGGQADESEDKPADPDNAESGDVPDDQSSESDADPDEGSEPSDDQNEGDDDSGRDDEGTQPQNEESAPPGQSPPPPRQEQQECAMPEPEYSEGEQLAPTEPVDDSDEGDWEEIAKQVETALQTMEKERGDGAGTFMDNLTLANRSRVNYDEFLRRFATRSEDAKLNDEEFDYIFYTYGLKLYENMPLVEPLEYKEVERIREFVIAIDTSGSCSHGLVQAFLTRTYEILSRSEGFGDRINVHIVQCDAEVQSDVVIHDIAELSEYERGFTVRGYGGTDFRPVFAFVNDLIDKKEFVDLRGMVYFTDGYGTFPTAAPDYDVAFVFVEEEGKQRRVPPWAMKVVLDENTLWELSGE